MTLSTMLRVWDAFGSAADLDPSEEPRIDAAVSRWIDSGERANTLLDLTMLNGSRYRALASDLRSWVLSTPETRRTQIEITHMQAEEDRQHKAELGIPWTDED